MFNFADAIPAINMLVPLIDRMTTHVISQRFTAAQAYTFWTEFVRALDTTAQKINARPYQRSAAQKISHFDIFFALHSSSMAGLTVEEQARAAAAKARAAAIERIYNTQPPENKYVKLTMDEDLHRGFKEGTIVLLYGQVVNPASPRIQEPHPEAWMYKIGRYAISGPKYREVLSPASGNQVIAVSNLTMSRDFNAGPVRNTIAAGSNVFLLREGRWGQGRNEVRVPQGTPCQIRSHVSRVGSGQPTRNFFQVMFWVKYYELDLIKNQICVRCSSLRPLAPGEQPIIPKLPKPDWSKEFPPDS
ncbi:hypothetical protein A0H81_03783 [Grifola frondosa]|uniref:Uncharacterized protein n=1 Tax=Grifola frondosa TaxID=5627 RepID=A0A1C7MJ09_GRIFR|nr:hypothetical protein A0H81_03783 [Grifola frondosa]